MKIICTGAATARRIVAAGHIVAIGIVVAGTVVVERVNSTTAFAIGCCHHVHLIVPFANNRPGAKPEFSFSFPFFSYGYQNIVYYGTP